MLNNNNIVVDTKIIRAVYEQFSTLAYFSASRTMMRTVTRCTDRTRNSLNKRDCNKGLTDNCRFCVKEIIPLCTFLCTTWHMSIVYSVQVQSRLKYCTTLNFIILGAYGG